MGDRVLPILDRLAEVKEVRKFEEVAKVDVGIVTGANKFFLVDDDTVRRYDLAEWAHPMFGRSIHCPGVIYDEAQHTENGTKGSPTNFLWLNGGNISTHEGAQEYIRQGEEQMLHTRYKCRIRTPWYAVPSVYATEVGMLKRANDTPRLILNKLGAYTTDTSYRIKVKAGFAEQLVFNFLNPLTALSAELEGRHYGGGVLELVPSEIEKLLIPMPAKVSANVIALDEAIRSKAIDDVIESQGKLILGALGCSDAEQTELTASWKRLRDRRNRVPTQPANLSPGQMILGSPDLDTGSLFAQEDLLER